MTSPHLAPQGRLAGKTGIIAGAAGGIGSSAARAFVAQGAIVGLLDRADGRLDQLLAESIGEGAEALPCDVTDSAAIDRAVSAWEAHHERLDFLYYCAGVQFHGADGPIASVSEETWAHTLAVNLTGAFLVARRSIELLCASGSGSLILCGSPTALRLSARTTAYAASKAGMMSLARSVASDYAERGVRANVIVPGVTRTPLISALLADEDQARALEQDVPLGRIGNPGDLDGIAIFLASDESRYATGSIYCVDGGVTAR